MYKYLTICISTIGLVTCSSKGRNDGQRTASPPASRTVDSRPGSDSDPLPSTKTDSSIPSGDSVKSPDKPSTNITQVSYEPKYICNSDSLPAQNGVPQTGHCYSALFDYKADYETVSLSGASGKALIARSFTNSNGPLPANFATLQFMDLQTGKIAWQRRATGDASYHDPSMIVDDDGAVRGYWDNGQYGGTFFATSWQSSTDPIVPKELGPNDSAVKLGYLTYPQEIMVSNFSDSSVMTLCKTKADHQPGLCHFDSKSGVFETFAPLPDWQTSLADVVSSRSGKFIAGCIRAKTSADSAFFVVAKSVNGEAVLKQKLYSGDGYCMKRQISFSKDEQFVSIVEDYDSARQHQSFLRIFNLQTGSLEVERVPYQKDFLIPRVNFTSAQVLPGGKCYAVTGFSNGAMAFFDLRSGNPVAFASALDQNESCSARTYSWDLSSDNVRLYAVGRIECSVWADIIKKFDVPEVCRP